MMKEKLFSGIAAFGIYFLLLGLIYYYFGYRSNSRPVHYVKKNEKGIRVSLAGPASSRPKRTAPPKTKKRHHPKPRNISSEKKTPPPKRTTRKKPSPKKPPRKKTDTRKLFSKIKIPQNNRRQSGTASEKPRKTGEKNLRKNTGDRGRQNAYLARVEELLRGWPAQVNFAGEEIDVRLRIYRNGNFDYRILKLSGNPDFNRELINYLKQLQRIGFGPHRQGRPYEIEVQFVAHE